MKIRFYFVSAILFTWKHPQFSPRSGVLAGAAFVTTFLLWIVLMILLRQFTGALDVFGLSDALSVAARTAREAFGGLFPVMFLMILIYDCVLCMLGGLVGFYLSTDGLSRELKRS